MAKVTLAPVTDYTQSTLSQINANSDRIKAALENTLSRDGSGPNQMQADIDLNNNDLVNVKSVEATNGSFGSLVVNGVVIGATNQSIKPVSPEMFGAKADGVSDDLLALKAVTAFAVVTGAEIFFGPNKTYKISDVWDIPSNVTVIGNGSTINGSSIATATSLNQKFGVRLGGSIGVDVAVTSNVTKGSKTISVASTAGLSAGDIILVKSNEAHPVGTTAANKKGVLHRIRSVNSGTSLTLFDGTFFDYDSTQGAVIAKVTPVKNVKIENLNVVMGGGNSGHNGFGLTYTEDCWLVRCSADKASDCGVRTAYCFGGGVIGGSFKNTSTFNGSNGYGVVVGSGCRNFKVEANGFRNNKHSIAGGGTHPAIFVDIIGNYVDGSQTGANLSYDIECHEDCLWWNFHRNVITGSLDSNGSGGLMVRGQGCTVSENTIINSRQYGIYVHSFDINANGLIGCKVINNIVDGARLTGIYLGGDLTSPLQEIEVKGNTVKNVGGEGIYAQVVRGLSIVSNVVKNATGNGIRLMGSATTGDNCTDFQITGNQIDGAAPYGIRIDYGLRGTIGLNNTRNTTSSAIDLENSSEITVFGGYVKTSGATVHGYRIVSCTNLSIRPGFMDGGGSSSSSAGVSISGTSNHIRVIGGVILGYQYPVRATGTVDYIGADMIDGKGCAVAIDIAASTNKSTVGNF